jgi:hypothetical protein
MNPDDGVLPLASRVALWCKDAGIDTDDARHAWLHAFSHGAYNSARDVPPSDIRRLRAMLKLHAAFKVDA